MGGGLLLILGGNRGFAYFVIGKMRFGSVRLGITDNERERDWDLRQK